MALASSVALSGALAASIPNVIEEQSRTVAGGRAIEVVVAQSEIKSDINPSNLAVVTGGGLLGGLLAASQNASRAKKAEAAITPLRDALVNFDVDGLSLETTKHAVAQVSWLQPTAIILSKDSSVLGRSGYLDSSGVSQVSFIDYSYDVSPDFASIRVVARLQFANKALPAGSTKPDSRLSPRNLAYVQTITSVISLPGAGKDINANAASWAADGGKAAKAALTLAFASIDHLLPRTLGLTAADIKTMSGKDKPRGMAGGFAGRMQESGPSGDLLWAGGFVEAQLLPQGG